MKGKLFFSQTPKKLPLGWMFLSLLSLNAPYTIWADAISLTSQRSASPLTHLHTLLAQRGQDSSDPATLLPLADLYLEIGQDIYQEESQKRQAFEEGFRLDRQVLDTEESNADAHYLYAADL